MHIFVAEDEKTIRRELTILLENAMYQSRHRRILKIYRIRLQRRHLI